jgi:hypothetical protein
MPIPYLAVPTLCLVVLQIYALAPGLHLVIHKGINSIDCALAVNNCMELAERIALAFKLIRLQIWSDLFPIGIPTERESMLLDLVKLYFAFYTCNIYEEFVEIEKLWHSTVKIKQFHKIVYFLSFLCS